MTSAARRAGASEEGGATKQRAVTVTRSNCAAESIVIDDVEQERREGQGVRKQPSGPQHNSFWAKAHAR